MSLSQQHDLAMGANQLITDVKLFEIAWQVRNRRYTTLTAPQKFKGLGYKMFDKLFKKYMKAKHHYYETQMDKIGGSKIHVPIPTSGENKGYGLAALVHSLWGSLYLAQPHKILRVSDEKVEYLDYTEQTENLRAWKGPLFDQTFAEKEERVLEISIIVFKLYISASRTVVVEEYAEKFRAITPPEFIDHYCTLNPHFLRWLYQTDI